jgi:RNA polymerase sigma factor (sigma-70 family)
VLHKDKKLLRAYRKGETAAYEELYRMYSEPVRRFLQGGFTFVSKGRTCRYRGGNAGIDADSILQETFARAFAASTRKNYDGERPFKNYLFSIAKNLVLREFQRRDRVLQVENTEEATDALARRGVDYGLTSSEQNPEHAVQDEDLMRVTREFIADLNDEERSFFEHRFARGLTQEGTADAMECTRARVKLLEKAMRRRFLTVLRDHGYFVGYTPKPRWSRQSKAA